jgi:hypothetical protein
MLQRFVDPAAVEAEIERVRSLSGNALRRRWQSVFGRSPPEHLTADLLRRMIANRIQERGVRHARPCHPQRQDHCRWRDRPRDDGRGDRPERITT